MASNVAYNPQPVNQTAVSNFNPFYVPEGKTERKEWCKQWLDRISNYAISPNVLNRRLRYAEYYNFSDGIFDVMDYAHVWATFGNAKPMTFTNYPLLSVLVDALVGDWLNNNLAFSVFKVNPEAIDERCTLEGEFIAMQMAKPYWDKLEQQLGTKLNFDDRMQSIPDNIKQFFTYDYRDMQEQTVYDGMNYIIEAHNEKGEFEAMLKDIAICNDAYGKIEYINGDPVVKRVHPMFALVDVGINDYSTSKIIDKELDSFGEERYLTHSEVLYNYGYWMTPNDRLMLQQMVQGFMSGSSSNAAVINNITFLRKEEGTIRIRCVEGEWKARNNVEFPVDFDPLLNKPKKESIDIFDVYEGVLIGQKIYCKCQKKKNALRNGDNYRQAQLDHFGVLTKYGIYPKAAPLQMLYNIVMSHIEFAINQAGGKAMVLYTDDFPLGEDGKPLYELDDLIYKAKVQGVILRQKKEGITPQDNYQQHDFGLSSTINNLYLFKTMIEQTASRMTGISPERFGFTKSEQAVGVTNSNVQYSATATQPLFYAHSKMIETGLQKAADLMKVVWARNDTRAYVVGDLGMKIIQMDEKLGLSDYGIFIRNSMKDAQEKQFLRDATIQTLAIDPAQILTVIKIMNSGSPIQAEKIIEKAVGDMKALEQQKLAIQQQQVQQQQQIAAAQLKQNQDQFNQKMDTDKYKADRAYDATVDKSQIDKEAAENVKLLETKGKIDNTQLTSHNTAQLNEQQREHDRQMEEAQRLHEQQMQQKEIDNQPPPSNTGQ